MFYMLLVVFFGGGNKIVTVVYVCILCKCRKKIRITIFCTLYINYLQPLVLSYVNSLISEQSIVT